MSLYDLLQPNGEGQSEQGAIKGVAIGIVTKNKDDSGLGRVKVRFPWRENNQESYWARIAAPMAGSGRGTYFLPEVDDEVLVAFEREDIGHPYIIGALWNGKDKPPADNTDGANNIRKIKSRSGHELIFDDKTNCEKVEIHTKAGHKLVLDDTMGSQKIEITDKGGSNSIVIDLITKSIAIKSDVAIDITSKKINIKADAMMTIDGGGMLTLTGGVIKIN